MISRTVRVVLRAGKMTMDYPELAKYAAGLFEESVERTAYQAQVSRSALYNILAGKRARPDTYERIALALGANRLEQREIYKQLMRFSGYLDLLPADDAAIDDDLSQVILREIQRQFPDVYNAAVALVEAREAVAGARKRGELPNAVKENHSEE